MDIESIRQGAKKEIGGAESLVDLNRVYKKYIGRKGKISAVFASLKKLTSQEKKSVGQTANQVKIELEALIAQKSEKLKALQIAKKIKTEKVDVTKPVEKIEPGHLHLLTQVQYDACDIFTSMGFSIIEGPEIETSWYNFDALNIPADHPARDLWDTFWIKSKNNLLLRTHTSPVQVRYMEKTNPPLRIIVPGRVFRREATDAFHDIQFYQLEGLMVDQEISASNFKAIITEFLNRFFSAKVDIRMRPSFFPFTEPSFEIDIKNNKQDKWWEVIGAGMVHPHVLGAAGLNSKKWQGFAFGMGLDRLAMLKYKLGDVRLFYSADLRVLRQF